jgi:hypothetical protein
VIREDDELQTIVTVGIARVPRGWVVVSVETQGDKVISKEVLSVDPEPRGHAVARAEVELIKQLRRTGVEA